MARKQITAHLSANAMNSWIEIDGERLQSVIGVELVARIGEPTKLRIDFIAVDADITAEVDEEHIETTAFLDTNKKWRVAR